MIYCLEDDKSIRELIVYTLQASGFEVRGFGEGGSFWQAVEEELPELVLLDIMLPGEDGLSILKKIRGGRETRNLPVIMATAKSTEFDKVIGLDMGADDYLAKPFGMMEMVSRVKALLRRSGSGEESEILSCGKLCLDEARHRVTVDGEQTMLTLKEYEVLKLLLGHRNHVFTREQLLNQVWGTEFVGESRTVDVHMGTLRTKLGICGRYIQTVRGVGYKLEVPDE